MSNQERIFIKGFDKNLQCWDNYQFEIGKEYKIELPEGYILSENDLGTNKVFHFCDSLKIVKCFYSCDDEYYDRFCEIEVLGQFCESERECKYGSNHIKIVREIVGEELNTLKGLINGNTGLFNTGYLNTGDLNIGCYNVGAYNKGNYNSGDWNEGDCNTGDSSYGDYNSGDRNRGDYNSGKRNEGNRNSGCRNKGSNNTGDNNKGYNNSGDRNKGNYNTGMFNKTNYSSGIFCNIEPKICVFNIQTDWTMSEFLNTKYYQAIMSSDFSLTGWKDYSDNTNAKDSLIIHSYENACLRWWEGLTKKNKAIIKEMPNFDIDVFCDITGIPKEQV